MTEIKTAPKFADSDKVFLDLRFEDWSPIRLRIDLRHVEKRVF